MGPVIINHVHPKFSDVVRNHPSRPVVIDHFKAERPWELPEEGEILAARAGPIWTQAPADAHFSPNLKWIQIFSTGIDRYPEKLLRNRIVTTGRGISADPIAEFVFAAMLRLERPIGDHRARSAADWRVPSMGRLFGRTLGLIGYGTIGQAIATRAQAFGMHVLAARRGPWKEVPPGITACQSPQEVFAASDHLVIAAPLTAETEGMVDAALLSHARPGLHLINISRGQMIDQDALLASLESGTVGYATLDVTTPEPLPDGHPLYSHPNAFISPHISWRGGKQHELFTQKFLRNLDNYLTGREMIDVLDLELGY